jgi:hypothetical protein
MQRHHGQGRRGYAPQILLARDYHCVLRRIVCVLDREVEGKRAQTHPSQDVPLQYLVNGREREEARAVWAGAHRAYTRGVPFEIVH